MFRFYDIEIFLPHFFSAELSFVIDDYYSFLISAETRNFSVSSESFGDTSDNLSSSSTSLSLLRTSGKNHDYRFKAEGKKYYNSKR